MHTIERISTVTLVQVTARMNVANARIRAAANDIVERRHKRGPAPICPSDLVGVTMPNCPTITSKDGIYTSYADESLYGYTHRGVGADLCASLDADAATLVRAIAALDDLAVKMQKLAAEYREATAAAIATHAEKSAEAAKTLVGLVAQV